MNRSAWTLRAACRGEPLSFFFPEPYGNHRLAKGICAVCPVRQECLSTALTRPEPFGYWGGATESERRRMQLPAA
jgi:WhiB family redox-sensing transcriptional regulator